MRILNTKSKGVTLVELSIVLAILGILIVATISGKSLIDISRATATIQQLSDRSLAFQIFSSTYDCNPGDCATTTVVGSAGSLVTVGVGDGDGKVEVFVDATTPNEMVFVEEHLTKAQLFNRSIGAITAGTTQSAAQNLLIGILPSSKVPGAYIGSLSINTYFYNIVGGASATENIINGVTVAYANIFKIIDAKIDDSSAKSGDVRCEKVSPTVAFSAFANTDTEYSSISSCVLFSKMSI